MSFEITNTNEKLAGAKMSPQFNSYLSLYSLRIGWSKAALMRKVMLDWYEKTGEMNPELEVVAEIANKYSLAWEKVKIMTPQPKQEEALYQFKKKTREQLIKKGLHAKHIELIIPQIR